MTVRPQDAIAAMIAAAGTLADAEEARALNEIAKNEHEAALVNSLVGSINPLTNKAHSASSATEAASQDERTVEYRRERIECEKHVTLAKAAYKAAEIRAWLAANIAGRVEVPAA